MGGKIDLYYDCVSPYSYFACIHILHMKNVLHSHGVEIEFFPVFLGGIMHKSGNQPPWKVKSKGIMSGYDTQRTAKYFKTQFKMPKNFPFNSLPAQRCLTYVKANYPSVTLEELSEILFIAVFQEKQDLSETETLKFLLSKCKGIDVENVWEAANSATIKTKLLETTDEALAASAFGCPWFIVTNQQGEKESFFGADRFHFMWEFLGLPWKDIEVQPKI